MKSNIPNITVTAVQKLPTKDGNYRYEFSLNIESEYYAEAYINCNSKYGSYVYFEQFGVLNKEDPTTLNINPYEQMKKNAVPIVLAEALKIDALSDWAKNVLDNYNAMKDQIIKSGFAHEQAISLPNGSKLGMTLCSYGEIKDLSDIDYYMTDSESIDSDESLYRVAENIVNEEKTKELMKEDKEKLFSFYQDEDIESLLQKPYAFLNEKDKDILSFFSDWHKDAYGYRPRGLDNECQYRLDQERNQNKDDDYEHE